MSEANKNPKVPNRLFDIENDRSRAELYRPPSLLRTTEWGLLTFGSLLAGFLFPPYFISVLWLAFFNAGGLLWVTHLSEQGRLRLKEFEGEFSEGHRREEQGDLKGAVAIYEALVPRYQDFPKIAEIAIRRIAYLKETQPAKFKAPAKKTVKAAKPSRRKRS